MTAGGSDFDGSAGLPRSSRSRLVIGMAIMASLVLLQGAMAYEPHGCDGFKWSLKQEAALLQAPGHQNVENGGALKIEGKAFDLGLVDFDTAGLPVPPERMPKMTPSRAGFVRYAAPASAGSYQLTLSQAAWINVIQNKHTVKPSAFSGALDCPGVRKSIRVTLAAAPFEVQFSGTQVPLISVVVAPVP